VFFERLALILIAFSLFWITKIGSGFVTEKLLNCSLFFHFGMWEECSETTQDKANHQILSTIQP